MEYKKKFIGELSAFLLTKGFDLDKGDGYFIKRTSQVSYIISLNISSSINRQNIIPSLLIVSNEISEKRKGFLNLKHKGSHYFTVISNEYELSGLYNKPEYKTLGYIITDETSFNKAVTQFFSFLTEIGFPFFERFKALADFDKWFSDPIYNGTYDFKRGNILNFAVEGLVAAKLNNNPHYNELYAIWMDSIPPTFTEALEIVKNLKDYLDKEQ